MSEELERPRLSHLDCAGAATQSGSGPGLRDLAGGMSTTVPVMTAYRKKPLQRRLPGGGNTLADF